MRRNLIKVLKYGISLHFCHIMNNGLDCPKGRVGRPSLPPRTGQG